ncbi:PREDICTED: protocadherin-8-like [Nanorana parkeri]|uniref:protocadherin-8-like n=1 Tax=Nanorana parkeri TaxID=125878 RepID=UPI0008547649|nr:PREDICTED: protocadherin-8-like [Nanorana parkeri]
MLELLNASLVLLLGLMTSLSSAEFVHYHIYEEEAAGTVIAVLSEHSLFNSTEQPESNFRLMKQYNNSIIRVQESDGQLSIEEKIDREQICRQALNCILALDVVSFSKDQINLINVKVEVRDINDNIPHFPSSEIHVDISESSAVGARIPLQIAIDEDIGANSIQNYELSDNTHFKIDVQTRADGVKYADLVLLRELDRESQSAYTLTLVAMDGGSPSLSGSAVVNVRVLDFNDNSPVFEKSVVTVDMMEDAPVGYLLLDLNAADPDEGANGEIVYSFSPQVSPEVRQLFHIDPKSGGITLEGKVDYESRQTYEFDIQAQDLSANPLTATCKITVHIIDANDNAPAITITPLTPVNKGIAYITEGAAKDSFVALIGTTDKDSGLNGQVHCTLYGHEHFKLNQAYEDSFMIVTTSPLDREKVAEYNLTIVAEDLGFPSLKTIKQYTVRLIDENDNVPKFTKQIYEASVQENNAPGTYITTVMAKDTDFGLNGKISYRLVDAKILGQSLSTFVAIDTDSGMLRAVRSLDYEKIKQLDLEIEASDNGTPQLTARTPLRIKIIDVNDNAPLITFPILDNGSAEVMLPIHAPQNYLVLQFKATDKDEGVNAQLSFAIQQDNQKLFAINKVTGELSLTRKIDSLQVKDLSIVIAVHDSGRPSMHSNANITFTLTESFPSGVEIVIMQSSAENPHQMDLSIIFIAVLSGGCALLLVAILFVACSCKRKSANSKTDVEEQSIREVKDQLLNRTTIPKETLSTSTLSQSESCQLTINTDSEGCSVSSSTDLAKDLQRASNSSDLAPLYNSSRWRKDISTESISGSSQIEHLSVKDSGKGDSDFNDSDSDTSGEGVKKRDSGLPIHKQPSSPYTGISGTFKGPEHPLSPRSNEGPYPGNVTMQYEKGYAMSYSLVPTYYNTYHCSRIPNVPVTQYTLKGSYYVNSMQDERLPRQCERDLVNRGTMLSPPRVSRTYPSSSYNTEISLQPCEIATTF